MIECAIDNRLLEPLVVVRLGFLELILSLL